VSREEEEGFLERKLDDITVGGVARCGGIQDSIYSDDRVCRRVRSSLDVVVAGRV